jgi:hypothetical protein
VRALITDLSGSSLGARAKIALYNAFSQVASATPAVAPAAREPFAGLESLGADRSALHAIVRNSFA